MGLRRPARAFSSTACAGFSLAAGTDLVHENPPALVLPFPLHQVPPVFSPAAGAELVHENPPALALPFPLHQIPRVSSPVDGAGVVPRHP